jgi:anti-sigma-K factor RskA
MGRHEELLELVAVYALGALPAREAAAVSEHLLFCPECRAEYDALRPVTGVLGFAAEGAVDEQRSKRMKARLVQRVVSEGTRRRTFDDRPRRTTPLWPAYLTAAAAIVIALINVVTTAGLRNELASSHDQIVALQQNNETLLRTQARDREMVADLVAADGKHLSVPGGEVITRGDRIYLAMDRLPPPPPGHVYQAWTLARGEKDVAPSLTFVPNTSGVAVIALPESAKDLTALALSVEPNGGSKQPTTKPLFVRQLE